ncbi:MAG TPA: VWA domain-containing protein, partial [Bacteroidales bacterium]|nr:VWA domain-containing protein [Bacteroidales bacterium]
MPKLFRYILITIIIVFIAINSSYTQQVTVTEKEPPTPTTRIIFIFDASLSMTGKWQSDLKINIAQKLLSELLDSLINVPNLELGLRVFGHLKKFPPQDCNDTKLEVPLAKGNILKIKNKLKAITPKGTTPIASSLEATARDFPPCDNCRNIIILITDGIEECQGDPCAVSLYLQKKGIILKPFIIGIGKNFKEAFDCVGTYFDATSEQSFKTALNIVITQALNSTTAQVNLLDINGNPTETNVNMTFYDNFSGSIKYNFVHTLNSKGLPDTLVLDPLLTYDIVVHTIPQVKLDSVKLTPGKHTIIPISAPQGYLKLKISGNSNIYNKNLPCIIRKKGDLEILHLQYFNTTEKYLVGKYDLEVLSLPRLKINDVDISQSYTTTV